jgi:hypothetical protein
VKCDDDSYDIHGSAPAIAHQVRFLRICEQTFAVALCIAEYGFAKSVAGDDGDLSEM